MHGDERETGLPRVHTFRLEKGRMNVHPVASINGAGVVVFQVLPAAGDVSVSIQSSLREDGSEMFTQESPSSTSNMDVSIQRCPTLPTDDESETPTLENLSSTDDMSLSIQRLPTEDSSETFTLETPSSMPNTGIRREKSAGHDVGDAGPFKCCICFKEELNLADSGTTVASVDGCRHRFCFGCIEQWAEHENTCPLCKTRFTSICRWVKGSVADDANTNEVAYTHVQTRDQSQQEETNLPDALRVEVEHFLSWLLFSHDEDGEAQSEGSDNGEGRAEESEESHAEDSEEEELPDLIE